MTDEDGPVTPADDEKPARDGNVHELPGRKGAPLEDQRVEQETDDDGQVQWVIEDQGRKISLGALARGSTPVLYHYSMGGKAIPDSQGGLIDPYSNMVPLVVDGVLEDVKVSYVRNSDRSVKEIHVYAKITPRVVYQARSEAAQVFLKEVVGDADAA